MISTSCSPTRFSSADGRAAWVVRTPVFEQEKSGRRRTQPWKSSSAWKTEALSRPARPDCSPLRRGISKRGSNCCARQPDDFPGAPVCAMRLLARSVRPFRLERSTFATWRPLFGPGAASPGLRLSSARWPCWVKRGPGSARPTARFASRVRGGVWAGSLSGSTSNSHASRGTTAREPPRSTRGGRVRRDGWPSGIEKTAKKKT